MINPVSRFSDVVNHLLRENAYPENTLVGVISKASWTTGEKFIKGPLKDINNLAMKSGIMSPAVLVIGMKE
jgi:precorrin-4 methylase